MFQLNSKNIIIIGVVGAVIVGGIFLVFSGGLPKQEEQQQAQEELPEQEVRSVAGKVTSVDVSSNSFVLLQPKEEREFTVKLGEETELIRLVFPFDIANPPAEATFTPKREPVSLKDLKAGDQVFVRSAVPIKTGQDVVNPLEVQILP